MSSLPAPAGAPPGFRCGPLASLQILRTAREYSTCVRGICGSFGAIPLRPKAATNGALRGSPAAGAGRAGRGDDEVLGEALGRGPVGNRFPCPEKSGDMSEAPCNLGYVFNLGATLCVLAVLTAQVPLIACDSDCHALLVSAALGHDCHTRDCNPEGAQASVPSDAGHSHVCGHQECHHEAPGQEHGTGDGDGGDPDGGEHEVIPVPTLRGGVRLTLPVLSVLGAALPSAPDALALPAAQLRHELVRAGEMDPRPCPPLGSVRLLL